MISWENFVTKLTSPLKGISVYEPGMYSCINVTETGRFILTYAHCAKHSFIDVDLFKMFISYHRR